MALSLSQLNVKMGQIADRVEFQTARLARGVIFEIGDKLITRTPVDTGFARAGWIPSLGAPALVGQSGLDPTGQRTIARVKNIGVLYQSGNVFFLVNRVPYLPSLNAGSSPQASPRFVQNTVRKAAATVFARDNVDLGIGAAVRRGF